jgi:DNA polymerase-1
MATIDTNVPVELDVDSMHAGDPDIDALRSLFTELEFTSLLKELLPLAEVSETHYTDASSAADIEQVLNSLSTDTALAVAVEHEESPASAEQDTQPEDEPAQQEQLSLMGGALNAPAPKTPQRIAIAATAGSSTVVKLDPGEAASRLKAVLSDGKIPKALH